MKITSKPIVKLFLSSITLLMVLTLAACTSDAAPTSEGLGQFVGEVNEDLFIAVAAALHPDPALERVYYVYLCDGAERSTWLLAESESSSAILESDDVTVTLAVSGNTVTGQLDIAGDVQPFVAEPAREGAGLFRMQRVGPPDYTGGWIILNSFAQRGALTEDGTVIENPVLNAATGTVETSLGTFSDITQLPCIPVPGWGCIPIPHPWHQR
jgi:hypothetical protein